MDERFEPTVLGTAAPAISLSGACLDGGDVTVGTRSVHPTRVARLDVDGPSIADEHAVPGVGGVRGMVPHRGATYFGTYNPARLYRIDPDGGGVTELAAFEDESFVWDVAAADGRVYGATYPNATVREYDVATDEVRSLGSACEETDYARSVVASAETVYVGAGTRARLVAIDRESGEKRSILPADLADHNMSYELALTPDEVVVRTTPDGVVCAIDRSDPDSYRLLDDGASTIAADGRDVYALCDGEIRRYGPDGESEVAGTAPVEFEPFALAVEGETAYGTASRGVVWRNRLSLADVSVVDLDEAGMSRGAEKPQAALAFDDRVYVTSHGTLNVHEADAGADVRALSAPGEGKALTAVDGLVYLAIYPEAHLAAYDPSEGAVETLTTIEDEQNRPRTLVHDPTRDVLFIGTRPDYGHIGGAVSAYDLSTGELSTYREVVADQSISAVAPLDSTVVLGSEIQGGLGIEPVAEEARVVGWDPDADDLTWEVTPVPETEGIADLVAVDGLVYGLSADGELFVVDPEDAACVHRAPAIDGWATLEYHEGAVYGLSRDALVRIDPESYAVTTLVDGLDGEWYGNPRITVDDRGGVYALSGFDLARIDTGSD